MEEEIIDTVYVDTLEVGDRVQYMDPEDGSWIIDTIKDILDEGDTFTIHFEDRDEPVEFSQSQRFDLYGYTTVEV